MNRRIPYTGPDKFIAPVWLSGIDITYEDESGGLISVDLEPGYYYAMHASDGDVSIDDDVAGADYRIELNDFDLRPLFTAIEEGLNLIAADRGSNNIYELSSATPAEHGLPWSGIEFVTVEGDDEWLAVFDSPVTEMMGLLDDSSFFGEGSFFDRQISPVSSYAVWHSEVVAHDRRVTPRAVSISASAGRQRYRNRWRERQRGRSFRYFDVSGENVRRDPAPIFGADDERDPHNRFVDIWELIAESSRDVVIIYNTGFEEGASLDIDDHEDVEVVRFGDISGFEAVPVTDIPGGERYDIRAGGGL